MRARVNSGLLVGGAALVAAVTLSAVSTTSGYPRYREAGNPQGGYCVTCHGQFTDGTSPKGTVFPSGGKHTMHRSSSYMNTECLLCHVDEGDNPLLNVSGGTDNTPGLGCSGCHGNDYDPGAGYMVLGTGLRRHHLNHGVTECMDCHMDDPAPLPESTPPVYYGSFDTNAFDPCNQPPLLGENFSLDTDNTDGLDNDGDGLYDTRDNDCGGCPWDCGNGNGAVDTADFLALLGTWGQMAVPCDFGLGPPGVDTPDFLAIIGHWGPCP